ncbi:MAG: nucleotidyltransferase family protein [Pseudonocardiaceae bacterium]
MRTPVHHADALECRASVQTGPTAELLLAIAASGLPGSMLRSPQRPLDDASWRSLLPRVDEHRLTGLLLKALASQVFPATAEQALQAQRLHAQAISRVLLRDAALLEAAETLDRAGIVWRALKGAATAHLVYADPAARPYRDVSVLVPTARFDDALQALSVLGYERRSPPLKPRFDVTFGNAVSIARADGISIDLRRTLSPGPFGLTVELDPLFQTAAVFSLGGRPIKALAPEAHFLHSCYETALGDLSSRLVSLRDVAQQALGDELNVERVFTLASAWAGEAVLAVAIRLAWERFALADVVPLSAWARRYTPSRRERRFLLGYQTRRFTHEALDSLQVIKGVGSKAAFLSAVALPDPVWLAHHDQRRGRWLRRGATTVLRRPRGSTVTGAEEVGRARAPSILTIRPYTARRLPQFSTASQSSLGPRTTALIEERS